ncbi:hypothetical protein [Modestobacter sp. SYSU DS0875]
MSLPPGAEVVVGGAGLTGLSAAVTGAQPAATPPLQHRRPVDLGGGLFVCGDHRETRPPRRRPGQVPPGRA